MMEGIIGHLHDHLQKMENTINAKVEAMVERVAEKKMKPEQKEVVVPPKATPCDDPHNMRITAWASNSLPTFKEMLVDYEQTIGEEEEIERRCRDDIIAEEGQWRRVLTQEGHFQGPSYCSDVGSDN